ncbi:Thioredoxin- transmembrane protein 1 [Geranomyces variabilis]|nr:Thioredoxin- transmembrane protein 1 [Geranomyces variabilis]
MAARCSYRAASRSFFTAASLAFFAFFALLLLSSPPPVAASLVEDSSSSPVLALTDSNFDAHAPHGSWLIKLYAPWCGACNRFAPEFAALARAARVSHPHIRLGEVDVDANPGLAARFMVARLPSLYLLENGTVRTLEGVSRTAAFLHQYLKDEKWRAVEPWSAALSPFAVGPRVLGYVGLAGAWMGSIASELTKLPTWAYAAIAVSILGVLFVATQFLSVPAAPPPPSPSQKQKQKKRNTEGKKTK